MPTPQTDDGKDTENSTTFPPSLDMNFDFSFFDIVSLPDSVDAATQNSILLGFNDEVERLVSMDYFNDTQVLSSTTNHSGLW
jgi:hypothetical protein